MIKFEHTEVVGWEAAIRGMRNPLESWEKSDSTFYEDGEYHYIDGTFGPCNYDIPNGFCMRENDLDLMKRLRNAGTDHRKFMRMIVVYVDITAPLYWWKEMDQYRVGQTTNSCSTMHCIHKKEFTLEDFSTEHLLTYPSIDVFENVVAALNTARTCYLECQDPTTKKDWWWQMIQLLPSSYNQKRTVMLNYEVLANIYKSRKDHKLDEWSEHEMNPVEPLKDGVLVSRGNSIPYGYLGFCDWIKTLPYSELITGEEES